MKVHISGGASVVPVGKSNKTIDPVEVLNETLEQIWQTMCCSYDAAADLPNTLTLFGDADLSKSFQAAKNVLANMLLEVMENVGRFSPWYTRPARAFGLTSLIDPANNQNRWMLAPEAVQKWQALLDQLATAIEKNYSLIQAMVFMEKLIENDSESDPQVIAHCGCNPPRTIQLTRSVLEKAEILCDACLQPFV